MKIAILQRDLSQGTLGGAAKFARGLADALVRKGHQVTVFSHDPAPPDAGFSVVRVPLKPGIKRLAPYLFPLNACGCDFSGFDIIHSQGDDQFLRHRGCPVVRTLHGSSLMEALSSGVHGRSPKLLVVHLYFYFMEFVAHLRADALTTVGGTRGCYVRSQLFVPNGIDTGVFSAPRAAKADHPVILFVGSLSGRKRGRRLVEVFENQVVPEFPEAELWLVCREEVQRPGIRWLGRLSDEELASVYQQAWIFCLPSTYEGFGRPYVEAMAAGTAVVATPNPGAMEVTERGASGLIVTEEKLGEGLLSLLRDEELREDFAKKGRLRASAYDWEQVVGQYEAVYAQVVKLKNHRAAAESCHPENQANPGEPV